MKSPARLDDALENGGRITSASATMIFMDKPLARQGDGAMCDKHGKTTIAEGDPTFPDQDGKPVAMHLHRCACGCRIVASLANVFIG